MLANSASYGIYAEIVREELPRRQEEVVDVHGALPLSFADSVPAPEEPGEFSFPPMAACITGGARLMLALLERLVTEQGVATPSATPIRWRSSPANSAAQCHAPVGKP